MIEHVLQSVGHRFRRMVGMPIALLPSLQQEGGQFAPGRGRFHFFLMKSVCLAWLLRA
jgi:hypothetical protein